MTFSAGIIYYFKILFEVVIFEIQIWIVQTKSDGEMTKIKVVDLDEFYKFVVYDVFIWSSNFELSIFWKEKK